MPALLLHTAVLCFCLTRLAAASYDFYEALDGVSLRIVADDAISFGGAFALRNGSNLAIEHGEFNTVMWYGPFEVRNSVLTVHGAAGHLMVLAAALYNELPEYYLAAKDGALVSFSYVTLLNAVAAKRFIFLEDFGSQG